MQEQDKVPRLSIRIFFGQIFRTLIWRESVTWEVHVVIASWPRPYHQPNRTTRHPDRENDDEEDAGMVVRWRGRWMRRLMLMACCSY